MIRPCGWSERQPLKLPGMVWLAHIVARVAVDGDCGSYGLAWRSGHWPNWNGQITGKTHCFVFIRALRGSPLKSVTNTIHELHE